MKTAHPAKHAVKMLSKGMLGKAASTGGMLKPGLSATYHPSKNAFNKKLTYASSNNRGPMGKARKLMNQHAALQYGPLAASTKTRR